ncbi:MAG TPA: HAMP domain-containing sensor histidine kinase [Phototrophicaceae bacterium]|nr:HAMP domain-containing sensor histidine kinase [Phototrophicaceae bacterium]
MASLKRFLRRVFQSASLGRTTLEVLVLGACLTLFVVLVYGQQSRSVYHMTLLFFTNPICALYYALRLRPIKGGWLRQLIAESVIMTIPILLLYLLLGVWLLQIVGYGLYGEEMGYNTDVLFLGVHAFSFVFFRVLARFLVWWNRLCVRRLLWSLVNNQLIAALSFQSAIALPLMLLLVFSDYPNRTSFEIPDYPLTQFIYRMQLMMPMLGLVILGVTTVLIALLPVSIVVSFFFARRTKRRLDALLQGAHSAQTGNYSVRITVSGQDEIAQLQTDFNAMVASLETTVNDLRAEQETVSALLKTRRELTANVSHELRTPVATVRAYLESALGQERGISKNDVEIVEREVIRLQTLIDDLFALSRAEVDQLALKCVPLDASLVINRVVETVAPLAWRINRVEVLAQTPPWLPPILADETRLEQVLRNLVHNSLRHTPPGGLIVVRAEAKEETALIEVRDTGEGIQPEDLPHVWERYYRSSSNGGTGLGLALVKSFTEAMGRHATVESVPGEGACFKLTLPCAETPPPERLPLPQPVLHRSAHCDKAATNRR